MREMMPKSKSLTILFVGVTMQLALSCTPHKPEIASANSNDSTSQSQISRGSIYDLNMTLDNQNGQKIAWQSLPGKIQVIAMIFTHCQATCPIIISQMKDVENLIPASDRDRVGFTLISFDSKRDSAARLKTEYDLLQLDPRWQLLHGNPDDIRTIASLLDVKFKEWPDGNFSHSSVFSVIDKSGHIVLRMEGIDAKNPEVIAGKIKELL